MQAFICLVLLITSISYANTQEEAIEQNNARISVYLHPAYIYFFDNKDDFDNKELIPIYSTVEIPFNLSNSLIVKPSLLLRDSDAFRLGSDVGFRHYLAEKGEGLYLQGQMGLFYSRRNDYYDLSPSNPLDVLPSKSLWLNPMGYAGYSLKYSHISMFFDIGLGAVMGINTETGRVKFVDEPWPDIDIGIGIPFGAAKLADAQEEQAAKQDNTRVSVYLHPLSIYSWMLDMYPIYLTVEIPFSLYNSLIIRPSFLDISDADGAEAFRLGSDIGFRHYLAGKGEGLYLQGQMGFFYYKHNVYYNTSDAVFSLAPFTHSFYYTNIPKKSLWIDAMGYIGYSFKFSHVSIFIDAGFGAVMGISTETGCVKMLDEFWPDLSIGIGVPF